MNSIILNLNRDKTKRKIVNALDELDIYIDEITKSKIYASTKSTLLSWGEDIFIKLVSIEDGKTKVSIESESKAQLISWGTNDSNIVKIINILKQK